VTGTMAEPVFLETSDVARALGVSAAAVQLWTNQGRVTPLHTIGGRRLFTPADLETLRVMQNDRSARRVKHGDSAVAA